MKRFFLFLVITTASLGCINAQSSTQNSTPQGRAKAQVAAVNKAVVLHGNQFGDVNKAYIEYYTKLDALNTQKSTLSNADYQSQLSTLQATRDTKVKSSLDAAQLKNWQAYIAKNNGN